MKPQHTDTFSLSWNAFKNSITRGIRLFHSQQFILPHHCTVGDFPSVASVAQGQVHRVDGLEGASEMNATILVSSVGSVELHCHAAESRTATDVHISPCK